MVALKLKHMVRDSNSGHQLLLPPSKRCPMFAYWVQVVEPIGGRDFKDCAGRESVPQEDGLNLSIASGYTTAEEPDHVSLRPGGPLLHYWNRDSGMCNTLVQ